MLIGLFFGVIGAIAYILADRLAAETKHRQLIKSESEKWAKVIKSANIKVD